MPCLSCLALAKTFMCNLQPKHPDASTSRNTDLSGGGGGGGDGDRGSRGVKGCDQGESC